MIQVKKYVGNAESLNKQNCNSIRINCSFLERLPSLQATNVEKICPVTYTIETDQSREDL